MARGGLASKGGMPALLAIPGKVKPEPEGDEYDEKAEADDDARASELGAAFRAAMSGTDDAAVTHALCDILDWHMGEEPEAGEEEGPLLDGPHGAEDGSPGARASGDRDRELAARHRRRTAGAGWLRGG